MFDEPLAPHHQLIGQWILSPATGTRAYTRVEARRHIERAFGTAVRDILAPVGLADLRVTVLRGNGELPPAIAIVCEDIGQLDLGWIETGDAPVSWRAAAYAALEETLGTALPVATYDDLFDEFSMLYWDGETDDEGARLGLIENFGADPGDLRELTLPSTMNARRPAWMIATKAARPSRLPPGLRQTLDGLRETHEALRNLPEDHNAWHFEQEVVLDYVPEYQDCASFPPLTLVPFEHFAREQDDVAQHGMEYGFMDIVGLCPMPEAAGIDAWLASLRIGARFLLAVQALIDCIPNRS